MQLLAQLDIQRSHSRPHVSNDNPYSESQFKTLKYHPSFPDKFGGLDDGLAFCREFFPWYNDNHHHSALACLTPHQVHYGQAEETLRQRHEVLMTAYQAHPERFVAGPPRMPSLARAVYINPPASASGDGLSPSSKPLTLSSGSAAPETEPLTIASTPPIAAGGAASSSPTPSGTGNPLIPSCPVLPSLALLNPSITACPSTGGAVH